MHGDEARGCPAWGLNLNPNSPMNLTTANPESHTASRPKVGQYKGHPMITLNPDDRFPFQFGLQKARLVLQHIEEIRKFVENAEHVAAA